MIGERRDLQKLKSIHTDLKNVMSKVAGLSSETEKAIRDESKQIEGARVKILAILEGLYTPL